MTERQIAVADAKKRGEPDCRVCRWVAPKRTMLHAHHVVPVSAGGSNAFGNFVQLCPNCHALAHYEYRKGLRAKTPLELIASLRKYHPRLNKSGRCHVMPVYEWTPGERNAVR